jgi:hypothetical protein
MRQAVLLTDRAVFRLRGAETAGWLNAIVTQNTTKARPGAPCFCALLTPQGKVIADFFLWAQAQDTFYADVAAGLADDLMRRLSLYRLRAKVEITPQPSAALAQILEGDPPQTGVDDLADDPRTPFLGRRVFARDGAELAAALAADDLLALAAYHARRTRLGVAEIGVDYPPDAVWPTDVGFDLLNGVDYRKGCFIGQEVASRMKRKGVIRRRPMVAATDAPAHAAILADGQEVAALGVPVEGFAPAVVRLDRLADAAAAGQRLSAHGRPVRLAPCPWMEASETVYAETS